jgi:hypothetical protein
MAINQKYSYNGYDPKSQAIIEKKQELHKKLGKGQIIFKSFNLADGSKSLEKAIVIISFLIVRLENSVGDIGTWKSEFITYYRERGYARFRNVNNEICVLNEQLRLHEITSIEYKLAMKIINDEVKEIIRNNEALEYKGYSAACTEMKRGWKRRNLSNEVAKDFNNSEIVGSNFAQEEPFTSAFPSDMIGVTFIKCNLGNCNIPAGNTVEGFNKHYKIQNDGEYWIVNEELKAIEPLSPKRYEEFGVSKDPKDLPIEKLEESIIVTAVKEKVKQDRKDKIRAVAGNEAALNALVEEEEKL